MDLRENKITIGEVIKNQRARNILHRNFPELMNPFLLQTARKMTLENTLKLATGPYAQEQITKLLADLRAL